LLLAALHNAWQLKLRTGASIAELLHAARQMQREGGLTFGQALMAANSPVLLQRSMIEGQPAEGIMATGTVAGVIGDLPSCAELVERIVREAEQRLAALAAGRYGKQDV
jgi:nitronate monooxygenase